MEFFKKVSDYFNKNSKKKIVDNAIIIIIIGVIIIIAGSSLFGRDKSRASETPKNNNAVEVGKIISSEEKGDVERKIEAILSQIEGAGKVNVMVTYATGKEVVPAYDTKRNENDTQEKDNGGGTRNIKQHDIENKVVYEEIQGGSKKPVIIKEIQPQVKGVVIVADGAEDPSVKDSLSRAVQVLMDIPLHKIQVFERNKK